MRQEKIENKSRNCNYHGDYVGGNMIKNYYITLYTDDERKFIVTHDVNIKPVSYFTGRQMELDELRKRIEEGRKSVLVSGMGGIGKTHICRKLFNEYASQQEKSMFHHIGYVEYDGDMSSSLQKCLKYKKQENPKANKEAAWRELEYLASDGKLLLFVDNVNVSIGEDPDLKRLVSIPGAIVLTSRRTSFSSAFEPYRIGFLSTEQCREIYEKIRFENSGRKVKDEEVQELEYVIEKLVARHTITIEFLAKLARTKCWTVKRLKEELEKNGFKLEYRDEEDILINIQKAYETLYDLSELTEAEQNILEAFSVFPYIPLSAEVCNQWLLSDAGVDESEDILVGLYRKGWLQFDIEQESYSMHPVFAQFIYEKCEPKAKNHLGLIESCDNSLKVPENGLVLECQQYILFAENIIKKIDIGKGIQQINFINRLAYLLQYISHYTGAEVLYQRLIEDYKDELEENSLYAIEMNSNLAYIYERQGEYKKAKKILKKILKISENVLGENDIYTANICHNLAYIYGEKGKYEKAKELTERSVQICKSILGEENFQITVSYNYLAGLYQKNEEYEKAKELYEKCLKIRKRILSEEHPDTARIYHNLAGIYIEQEKYGKAIKLYKKSLQIEERMLGENHQSTAKTYNNLAYAYEKLKKYKEAEKLYEKSLKIRKNVLGREHPDTAKGYYNLAGVYARQGKYENVLPYCLKAYKIFLLKFGLNHKYTQSVYNDIKWYYNKCEIKNISFEQWLETYLSFLEN